MKSFEYTISLDQQETETKINRLLVGNAAYPALYRLASACLPDPDALRKLIADSGGELLLSRLIPRATMEATVYRLRRLDVKNIATSY